MSSNVPSGANARNPLTLQAYSANYYKVRKAAERLPVAQRIAALLSIIEQHNVVVLVGETGSGKTTQVPQAIMMANAEMRKPGGKKLALTQTRRLAADMVANRIAEELDVGVGGVVGIRHRGRNAITASTCLEVITDGSLVAAARADPSLSDYGVIIIDEAHQHTVATDILLGLLKGLAVTRRDDLKIIIMSATIDAALFTDFFPGSALEIVSGRQYSVAVSYLHSMPKELFDTIVDTILQLHLTQTAGDILVFVSGTQEIFKVITAVRNALSGPRARFDQSEIGPLECWPLHAQLSQEDQDATVQAMRPENRDGMIGRKVVVATNIAETSITLTGIKHVISSCRVKSKIWNCKEESWSLQELWASKAEIKQQSGRAGRIEEGYAWRMCTESAFCKHFNEHAVPAIVEGDMMRECLDILKLGHSPVTFPYMVAPASSTIIKAMELLKRLGAVDVRGELTAFGQLAAVLPVDVCSAKVLLVSPDLGCSDHILSIIAMVEATEGGTHLFRMSPESADKKKIRAIRDKMRHPCGDHLTLLNIYMSWREACAEDRATMFLEEHMLLGSVLRTADQLRKQLLTQLRRLGDKWRLQCPPEVDCATVMMALAAGNFLRVAKRPDIKRPKLYQTVRGGFLVELTPVTQLGEPSSINEWVIYNELNDGKEGKTIRLVSAVPPEILVRMAPSYWWTDAEFLPEGDIQDGMARILARMTGQSEASARGGM